ncbi:MAG TPA: DMT family transporter, partial [Tenuifilaceae bacterium]|nr:DMT family transporter [Tenuifilaceae bacterium]
MKNSSKPYLFASFVVLFWGTSATAFKIGLRYMDFIQLLFWSSLFAALILLFVLILRKNIVGVSWVNRIGLFQAMLFGLLNPFLYYLVLFKAYSLLPAQVAQPLNYIWPIVLVLMSAVFLKQRLHWYDLLALFVSFCGVVLISSQGSIRIFDTSNPIGVVLALASS